MIISIEGMPGSGKTTMIQLLKISKLRAYSIDFDRSDINIRGIIDYILDFADLCLPIDCLNIVDSCPDTMIHLNQFSHDDRRRLSRINRQLQPDYIIFLHASPEVCLARLQERETGSDLNIENLKQYFLDYEWFFDTNHCGVPVYRLNTQDTLSSTLYNLIQILKDIHSQVSDNLADDQNLIELFRVV